MMQQQNKVFDFMDTILSGNCWKVRILAGHLGIQLNRTSLNIVGGDLQKDEFASINPLKQVPALKTTEGVWLSESTAILWYLAEGSPYLPNDALGRAQVVQWLMFEQTKLMWFLAQPRVEVYLRKNLSNDDPKVVKWRNKGMKALLILEVHLQERQFIVNEQPTIADFNLYPYIRMAPQGGYDLTQFTAIHCWLDRVSQLKGHTPLLEDDPTTI